MFFLASTVPLTQCLQRHQYFLPHNELKRIRLISLLSPNIR